MSAATAPVSNPKPSETKAHEPSMEEILASIRRIIADDQALPLTPRPSSANLRAINAEPERPPASLAEAEVPRRGLRPTLPPEGVEAELASQLAATLSNTRTNTTKSSFPEPLQPRAAAKIEPVQAAPEAESFRGAAMAPSIGGRARSSTSVAEPLAVVSAPEPLPGGAPEKRPPNKPESSTQAVSTLPPTVPAARDEKLLSPSADASVASSFNALATTMFIQNNGMVEQAVRDMLRPMLQCWLDDNLPTMVERLVRTEIERVARGGR
jgi:hypothetical protein